MSKSKMLIVVGVLLLAIAFLTASRIPLEANRDLSALHDQHARGRGWVTSLQYNKDNVYIQAHGHRRLLQNFYMGASGLICLYVGLLSLPDKKTAAAQPQPHAHAPAPPA